MDMTPEHAVQAKYPLKYYRVGNRVDDLPFWVRANTTQEAIGKVEALCGPIPANLITCREVKPSDIPEGEDLIE